MQELVDRGGSSPGVLREHIPARYHVVGGSVSAPHRAAVSGPWCNRVDQHPDPDLIVPRLTHRVGTLSWAPSRGNARLRSLFARLYAKFKKGNGCPHSGATRRAAGAGRFFTVGSYPRRLRTPDRFYHPLSIVLVRSAKKCVKSSFERSFFVEIGENAAHHPDAMG